MIVTKALREETDRLIDGYGLLEDVYLLLGPVLEDELPPAKMKDLEEWMGKARKFFGDDKSPSRKGGVGA